MIFKRSSASYGPSPFPETPYQKAGQIWEFAAGLPQAKQSIRGMDCRRRTPRQRRIGSRFNPKAQEA
jgi:hypothetical protein